MAVSRKRKKSRKPAARAARGKARSKAVSADTGPVTLDEAKALARVTHPSLAKRAVRKAIRPPASPEAVGLEREKLEKERREEIAQRIREYTATMAIMKRRGARRPPRKGRAKTKEVGPKGGSFVPLQVFAEGDSWFHYPAFLSGGIIPRLERRLGVPILNLAKAGDEVRYMLGVEERTLLAAYLRDGCPAGGAWDALLFSGGGNDIVDNPMVLWIKDWNPALPPAGQIHQERFDHALALVRAGYEDLIAMRDELSPGTHLIFQGYDFAIPDGRGICHLGPWLKPSFDYRRFPTLAARHEVVKILLRQFAAMLTSLAAHPRVTFINGQGTLAPNPSAWHNELHPAQRGFDQFADIFHRTLKQLFPDRVA